MITEKKDKQSEIYNFIKDQIQLKGYPPSVREICEAVGLKSTSTVHGHLERLEKKGYVETKGGKMVKKKKNKKSFPDMSGDGKVTKKDILIARGVIKKKKK